MSEQIERAARAMTDDWNPDRDPILTAMFRDYANTLAAAGLLTSSGTFASTKPSDADVAERCPECRSTQLTWFSHYPTTVPPGAYNLTEPTYVLGCDECSATVRRLTMDEALPMLTGSPLPNTDVADETALAAQVRADLEAAGILAWTNGGARIVQTVIEYVRTRSHATSPLTTEQEIESLAAEIHEAYTYHGTYTGGAMHGEPYSMCLVTAERIIRRRSNPPAPSPEIPGFEGTRSALDGLTIRKDKTSD